MCCCCCGEWFKGHTCMRWLLGSIICAFFLILVFVSLEIVFGGPLPTYKMANGSRLLYVSNVVTIITCTIALLIILNFVDNIREYHIIIRLIIFGVANALLVCTLIANVVVISFVFVPITEKDVVDYSKEYRLQNEKMPPSITTLEWMTKGFSVDSVPMGCCGHTSFNDYNHDVEKCQNLTDYKQETQVTFTAPPSCCKSDRKVGEVTHAYCTNPEELKNNTYISYDAQLFIQRLFNKIAKNATEWNDVKDLAKSLGVEFADWISGNKSKTAIAENELPESYGDIDFKPAMDCNYPMKAQFKEYLGDWDNKTLWHQKGEKDSYGKRYKTKDNAGDNYLDAISIHVKTNVLGCGALLELLLGQNNFVKVILDHKGVGFAVPLINGFRIFVLIFILCVIILAFLNVLFFNYYYIPLLIFPDRWSNLPFYPN